MSQVKKAFEYVRKMVRLWVREFEERESYWANELLRHFHKWISSQTGALYDPLLTRLVHELMKKVFHLLARRLEQLGLQLVYANFNRLVVATNKHTLAEARSSVEFALKKCVQENQKLFRYIGLTPCSSLYKALAFRDQFNFVGKLENGEFNYRVDMAELLAPGNAKYFKLLIVHLVENLAKLQDQLILDFGSNKMQLFLDYDALLLEKLRQFIANDYRTLLLDVLRKLQGDWETAKEQKKHSKQDQEDTLSQGEKEEDGDEEEEEEENDSFIDDGVE